MRPFYGSQSDRDTLIMSLGTLSPCPAVVLSCGRDGRGRLQVSADDPSLWHAYGTTLSRRVLGLPRVPFVLAALLVVMAGARVAQPSRQRRRRRPCGRRHDVDDYRPRGNSLTISLRRSTFHPIQFIMLADSPVLFSANSLLAFRALHITSVSSRASHCIFVSECPRRRDTLFASGSRTQFAQGNVSEWSRLCCVAPACRTFGIA